jgi:hypothetical protein
MNSVIEKFLREGNNVNKFSRIFAEQQAPMPLIYPIIKMNPEGVKLLLDADADPNIKVGAFFRGPGNQPKYTNGNALVWAAGYTGIGVELGSRKFGRDGSESDYFRSKKKFNLNRVKIIRLLLEYGADPFDTSYFGHTALDLVKMQRPSPLRIGRAGSEENDEEIIELLEKYMIHRYLPPAQSLALAKSMESQQGPFSSIRYDPSLFDKVASYVPEYIDRYALDVNRRMIKEHDENDRIADFLNSLQYQEEYNTDDYDIDGYDVDGYDANGYDVDGYDVDGYDANGYDVDGYDVDGYDANGYDVDGYDANGYDVNGYDIDGNKKQSAGYKIKRKHKTKKRNYRFY